ncbi:MAG: hypothetical protein EA353_10510, partial [Puniceicoccaceae bacterium]
LKTKKLTPPMKATPHCNKHGYSLVEVIISMFVLVTVITGVLASVGLQVNLSEKTRNQALADFHLRSEVERLRSMPWAEIEQIVTNAEANRELGQVGQAQPLQTLSVSDLASAGLRAETQARLLSSSGESGKAIFRISLFWGESDAYEESRVFVVSQGGLSAN